jgi:type I restriction enzyme S subunit
MFGDPREFADRWPSKPLGELGTLDRGRSQHRPRNAPHLYGGPYPFVQTGDVANAQGYLRQHNQTYSKEGLKQSRLWPVDTLCVTIAANIAKTAIITYPVCFPDSVVGFTAGPDVTVEFIQGWFGFFQEVLETTAPEVAQKNINLEILRGLPSPVPPLGLQRRYTAVARETERLRVRQRESCRQAEHLFDSLLDELIAMHS